MEISETLDVSQFFQTLEASLISEITEMNEIFKIPKTRSSACPRDFHK